ncbi:mitotic checkpoint serine/threonine-protein kinase BUB1 [Hoplias malabaricus]|uniref:mitotic checkpoint serine/threonine-protein kinase BUB1 n=1 Tax=Hoplias malabaricus TaxID=27720 RepID=UPI003463774D
MDIGYYLQGFEASMSSYSGDDPLDPWDRFVDFVDSRLSCEDSSALCVVLERLVQTFLKEKRYHNDPRFIRHCIRCASYYPEPLKLYSSVYGCGVGTRAAALYVAWAQQLEAQGQFSEAEQVLLRALENRAEPLDIVQNQYRLFQSRTAKPNPGPSDVVRNPLQNSQLMNQNQNPRPRETLPQTKESENPQRSADRTICVISRSENNPKPSGCEPAQCVSMYCVKELQCEGSELSFEELRARRYFSKQKQQDLQRKQEEAIWRCEEEEEELVRMKKLLEELNSKLTTDTQQELCAAESFISPDPRETEPLGVYHAAAPVFLPEHSSPSPSEQLPERPLLNGRKSESHLRWSRAEVPASTPSLSLSSSSTTQHTHSNTQRGQSVCEDHAERSLLQNCPQPPAAAAQQDASETHGDTNEDLSRGVFNLSHVTPNSSLGLISATPSRVLPSPTVNTREALGVIMDMFQAPTLLQDTMFNNTHLNDSFERNCRVSSFAPPVVKPAPLAPFRIYQDENGENRREEPQGLKAGPAVRALMEIPVSKPSDTPVCAESLTDETAMWGPRYSSITTCPNYMQDFALSAHLVSTPLHSSAAPSWDSQHQENTAGGFSETSENPFQRQPAKLSPILEQSPSEESPEGAEGAESSLRAQGTIVGEGVSLPPQNHTFSLSQNQNQSSLSVSRHPLGPLVLPDHTAEASRSLKPSWSIYQSPERTGQTGSKEEPNSDSVRMVTEPKLEQLNSTSQQINSSAVTRPSWSIYQSPERTSQTGSNTEPNSDGMHLVREPKLDQLNSSSTKLNSDGNLNASTKTSWSIYQSPDRTSQTGSHKEPKPNSMLEVTEPKLDQLNSTSFLMNSTKPSWSIYQSPERTSQTGSNTEPKSDYLSSTGLWSNSTRELQLDQNISSSHLSVREPRADRLNSSHLARSSGSDVDDVLLPKQSFHRRKSEKQNPDSSYRSSVLLSSPEPAPRGTVQIQDVPMSPDPAPGFGWFQVESPGRLPEPDLDVMVRSMISRTPAAKSRLSLYQKPPEPVHIPQSPEPMEEPGQSPVPALEKSGIMLSKRSFNRRKSDKRVLEVLHRSLLSSPPRDSSTVQDVPMSPAPQMNWFCAESPVRATEPDLDVMMTPQRTSGTSAEPDVFTQQLQGDVPMSPSPGSDQTNPPVLVSDPWDEDLILSLLSSLKTPLSSYQNLSVWNQNLPSLSSRTTVQLGEETLRVDFVLGQGAFATVYQATHLSTSRKLILKVQKPANPWEFYINTQLNARLEPRERPLFNQLHSAHLFSNGSVLLGEPHTCGTLLDVVNLYKSRSERVMPQPLVLYFSACILQMVEQLHKANIIHADIKPDNFLLGARFLANEDFGSENVDHGLVLIDFGQSIDMTLFPEGTAFTARCMTSGFQCTEMLSNRPWSYQTDYFGVAGTVHCLMFGSYMQVTNEGGVWRTNGVFKRNPHSELWQEFFCVMLNVSGPLPWLQSLRSLRERLFSTLQQNYSNKLRDLKKRLVVQILESRHTRR